MVTTATTGVRSSARSRGDEAVARADLLVGGDAEDDDVDVGEGLAHQVVEALAQQGAGAVEAGGVDQDDLRIVLVDDAAHVVAGGLGGARR